MPDPEVNEDRDLAPYQGELFPKGSTQSSRQFTQFKTRGEVRGYSKSSPLAATSTPDWMQKPSGNFRIEYDESAMDT